MTICAVIIFRIIRNIILSLDVDLGDNVLCHKTALEQSCKIFLSSYTMGVAFLKNIAIKKLFLEDLPE